MLLQNTSAKRQGFKEGDKFVVATDELAGQGFARGAVVTLVNDDSSSNPKFKHDVSGETGWLRFTWLEVHDPKFKQGQRIKDVNGREFEVVGYHEVLETIDIYDDSRYGRYWMAGGGHHNMMDLDEIASKPGSAVELTLEEIAAKFNIPVDQLRIKKEA